MNMIKLNSKLTAQVISFTETMNAYQGIEQANSFYTYHRENGTEVLDIDFRLKLTDNGLTVSINKSHDKDAISGGHYTEDTQIEVDINALAVWLEDNRIYSKQAHKIANKLYNAITCVAFWDIAENEFYREVYTEYEKCSCETATAIQILLEKLTDLTDRYYVEKVWLNIQLNEEKINNLF